VPPQPRSHTAVEHWVTGDRPSDTSPRCAVCSQKRDRKPECDVRLVETDEEARDVLAFLRACPGCGLRREEVTTPAIGRIYLERWRSLRGRAG
jgi:hypothetical protein